MGKYNIIYIYIEKRKPELRRVPVPPHRVTPLKNNWEKILTTLVENMKL